MKDCRLRSFSELKRQAELHYFGWVKNNNKRNLNRYHKSLIIQLRPKVLGHTRYLYKFSGIIRGRATIWIFKVCFFMLKYQIRRAFFLLTFFKNSILFAKMMPNYKKIWQLIHRNLSNLIKKVNDILVISAFLAQLWNIFYLVSFTQWNIYG